MYYKRKMYSAEEYVVILKKHKELRDQVDASKTELLKVQLDELYQVLRGVPLDNTDAVLDALDTMQETINK